jgi:hypothetical protein
MKFTSKLAAAVIASVAFSAANAAILDPNTGDSEILVFLRDTGSGSVYSFDTGVRISQFDPTAASSFNLAGGALFNTWKSTVTGTIQFSLAGGDSLGPFATAGSRSFLFTTTAGANPLSGVGSASNQTFSNNIAAASAGLWSGQNSQQLTFSTGASTHIDPNANNGTGIGNGDFYSTAVSGGSSFTAYAGNVLIPFGLQMVDVGQQAEWFKATTSGGSTTKPTVTDYYKSTETATNLGGFWTLNNAGALNYTAAPVPEASEWAMMLAGLGFISLMVRRRSFSA